MDILIQSLTELWHDLVRLAPHIVIALVVLMIFVWAGRWLGKVVVHLIARGNFKPTHTNFFRNLTGWLMAIFGLIIALNILGFKGLAASLVAGGGITAVVLGFAFREIGENFLAGFFLAFSRPFEIGDLIQSGDLRGIVRSIEMRSTHIRSDDGKDIFIPSSQIFNSPLTNYTKDGLRRLSFTVGIDYADDSQRARELLVEMTGEVPHVLADPRPGANLSALAPAYVEIEVFFWIDMFQKGTELLQVRSSVIEACRRALMTGGFTVSSNVSTNLAHSGLAPLDVNVHQVAG